MSGRTETLLVSLATPGQSKREGLAFLEKVTGQPPVVQCCPGPGSASYRKKAERLRTPSHTSDAMEFTADMT